MDGWSGVPKRSLLRTSKTSLPKINSMFGLAYGTLGPHAHKQSSESNPNGGCFGFLHAVFSFYKWYIACTPANNPLLSFHLQGHKYRGCLAGEARLTLGLTPSCSNELHARPNPFLFGGGLGSRLNGIDPTRVSGPVRFGQHVQ